MKVAKQIYPLTSLRFFAALLVVLHHTIEGVAPAVTRPGWLNRLHQYTGSTVLLFFILSGYVLAVVYLAPEEPIDRRRFWIARFARVYPLYFVTLVLDAPNLFHYRLLKYGAAAALVKTSISFAGSALLLQQWFISLRGIDFPNWSLSVEALFYLVFPLIGAAVWRQRIAMQAGILVGLIFVLEGLQSAGSILFHVDVFAYAQPITYLPYFIAGIFLLRIHRWLKQSTGRSRAWAQAALPLTAVTVALLVLVCAEPRGSFFTPAHLLLPGYSLLLLCFAAGNRWMDAVFSHPWLVLLGEASYALYLLHVIVATWFFGYARIPITPVTYILYLLVAILLSIGSFYYLEGPARREILHRWHVRAIEREPAASSAQ